MKKAQKCPVCGSNQLKFVHYAPPEKDSPDCWDYGEDGMEPMILFKRVECRECGATVPNLVLTIDMAIDFWNDINPKTGCRYALQKIGEEQFIAEQLSPEI